MNPIGVSTWVWTSPLDDASLDRHARWAALHGFDVLELPIEDVGDWDPGRAAAVLAATGLGATVCAVMSAGRDLSTPDRAVARATSDYLSTCLGAASIVGSPVVAGPIYAPVGELRRLDAGERAATIARLVDRLRRLADAAARHGVRLALEPLNRFETSLVNTVAQALEIVDAVGSPALGICVDTFHQNIEEKDPAAAVRAAGHAVVHVQACGTDRGSPGQDRFDWPGLADALDAAGYRGPICIESFTADTASIATSAAIWRPLAPSQDALAIDGLRFLRDLFSAPRAAAGVER